VIMVVAAVIVRVASVIVAVVVGVRGVGVGCHLDDGTWFGAGATTRKRLRCCGGNYGARYVRDCPLGAWAMRGGVYVARRWQADRSPRRALRAGD
jgi:hypothetical protein